MGMSWTCEQTEARLSDYLDGVLNPAELAEFAAHVPSCTRCAPLVASVSDLLTGLHGMEQIEAPPRLVYSILDKTLGPRESVTGWRAIFGWIRSTTSIRFAYGTLSVAATLVLFVTASGLNWRHPKVADLRPATIYRKANSSAHLAYASSVKFVNDLRVVNEIQSRLREDSELQATPENVIPATSPQQKEPGSSDGAKPTGPRQQNRANDLGRNIEMLAMELPAAGGGLGGL
jgi:anti-sigma factor RsiW